MSDIYISSVILDTSLHNPTPESKKIYTRNSGGLTPFYRSDGLEVIIWETYFNPFTEENETKWRLRPVSNPSGGSFVSLNLINWSVQPGYVSSTSVAFISFNYRNRNIIKGDGGTGKLIGTPRTYYYVFRPYPYDDTIYLSGPLQEISSEERQLLAENINFTLVENSPIFKLKYSNIFVYKYKETLGIGGFPNQPFEYITYYYWNYEYRNFNDPSDPLNGATFGSSFSTQNESVPLEMAYFIGYYRPVVFKLIGRFPTSVQVINSIYGFRNGIYTFVDYTNGFPRYVKSDPNCESEISIYMNEEDNIIAYLSNYDLNSNYEYINESAPITLSEVTSGKILYPYQFNPYSNYFYTNDASMLDDLNIKVIPIT